MIPRGIFLLLLLAVPAADKTAAINGTIVDQNNNPISGAEVIILPGYPLTTVTDEKGTFSLDPIESGKYTVIILKNSFTPWVGRSIRVESRQKATLDITLLPGVKNRFRAKYLEHRSEDLSRFNSALQSFGEPDFCSASILEQNQESYRFLWLRTFHHPVLIQLIKRGPQDAAVNYKELDGRGGYEYGSIVEQKTVDVYTRLEKGGQPKELIQATIDLFFESAKAQVWEQPFALGETIDTDGSILIVLDGARWTIEAVKNGKCHVVTRHDPDTGDPVRHFAETLIDLSGKRFYYDEFY